MADLVLGGVEKIIRTGLKIKNAVDTVQQNKVECRGIQRCVDRVTDLLSLLKEVMMGEMMHHPTFIGPLDDLAESMEAALKLVTECQQKSALLHLLGAGDMAKKLCRVKDDIHKNLLMVMFAIDIQNLKIVYVLRDVSAQPQLLVPQVAGHVNSYDRNLSAIEMRPEVNNYTTMVTTGNAVPYASSSRLAEFNWSERESTLHFSSEEHIIKDGHAFIMKQEIVIKVVPCDKSRSKAMALAAALDGVDSVAISGRYRDELVVVSQGVDSVKLINALRKKGGKAYLLTVGSVSASRSNWELPARQRFSDLSSGSSSDSDDDEEEEEDPRPSSSKGKGKQSLEVARPHVAIGPGGSSDQKGFLGHLCSRFCFANHE